MKKQKRALKNTMIILLSIFIVLFLVFLLTFDLTDKSKYENKKTKDETTSYLVGYLNDALSKSSILNYLDVELDDDFVDNTFYLLLVDDIEDGIIFKTKNYIVKGYNFKAEDSRVTLNLYVTYMNIIKYDTIIKISMEYVESSTAYILKLRSINIGSIIIPSLIVGNVLRNHENGSLGSAIAEFLKSIPVGTYNQNTLEFSISKNALVNEMENGAISNLIFKDNKSLSTLVATYAETLFTYDLVDIRIKDSLNLIVDYSKLVNLNREIEDVNFNDVNSIKYDILVNEFLGKDSINLTKTDLRNIMMYEIFKDYDKDKSGTNFVDFLNVGYQDLGSKLIISIYVNVYDKLSIIDYSFIKRDNNYFLDYIEIGHDEGENIDNYLRTNSTDSKQDFLTLLNDMGIESNLLTETISPISLIKPIGIKDYDLSLNSDSVTLSFSIDEEIVDGIKNAIYSDEFKSSLSDEIKSFLDYNSDDEFITSFTSLSYELKKTYFSSLKDFLKTKTLVYNYINEIY